MFAEEASSTQSSLCWDGDDNVPQFSPNFGRKGGFHGNARVQFLYFIRILKCWFVSFIQHLQDKIFCVYFLSFSYLGEKAFTFFKLKENIEFFSSDTAVKKTISQHGSFNDIAFVA